MDRSKKHYQKVEEFKKKIRFNEKLGLDNRDNIILSMVQNDPDVSQDEIAKRVKLSQPSVGARIKRLKKKGILQTVNGINFRVADLFFAKIDVHTNDTTALIKEFRKCPFFINALITSGRYNLVLFFMATELKRLEAIVNYHLRRNEFVKEVELNIIISTAKDFVMPLNIDYDNKEQVEHDQACMDDWSNI